MMYVFLLAKHRLLFLIERSWPIKANCLHFDIIYKKGVVSYQLQSDQLQPCWNHISTVASMQNHDYDRIHTIHFSSGNRTSPEWYVHIFLLRQRGQASEFTGINTLQGPSRSLRRNMPFSVRVVTFWNRLPSSILTALSDGSFKRQLHEVKWWGPVKYPSPFYVIFTWLSLTF